MTPPDDLTQPAARAGNGPADLIDLPSDPADTDHTAADDSAVSAIAYEPHGTRADRQFPPAEVATPVVQLKRGRYVTYLKPSMDRAIATILLIPLAPILLVGMIAVRTTLGPGVFFVQLRVGRGGRIFRTYKLRTMNHDRRDTTDADLEAFSAGEWDGMERRRTHKSAHDPRLNTVGRLLRTFSVDEIPQLFNILRGDMSLVGPRPELPSVVRAHYQPWMHRRHAVKPGLTGLWQVSERGNGMMHEHVDVDLDYVDSIGPWTDLCIILRTPYAALGPRRGF